MMKKYIGIFIALGVFIIQCFTLPYAGMTWDEPSVFLVGRSNLRFWMTGNRQYLNDMTNQDLNKGNPMTYMLGADNYPPFSYLVESVFSFILSEKLHLLNLFDAYHLGGLTIAAFGIAAFYGLATALGLPVLIASVTTLIYSLYPTIVGQMRNDPKDIPVMSMIVMATYVFILFIKSWEKGSDRKRILLGAASFALLGLAASIKPTAFYMFGIFGIWFLFSINESKSFYAKLKPVRRIIALSPLLVVVAIGIFLLSWPWVWDDPYGKIKGAWDFFSTVGFHMPVPYFGKMYRAGISLPPEYPWGILLIQTPVEITILAVLGMIASLWLLVKKDRPYAMLPFFWFFLGMGRFFIDGVIIYAKVRQFSDVMPAFFLLAGFGIMFLADRLSLIIHEVKKHISLQKASLAVILTVGGFVLLHELWIIKTFFPYEPSYFNVLVGGTRRVAEKQLFDVEYWGTGVKEAMEFINTHGPAPITVYPCQMRHLAINYRTDDVRFTELGEWSKYAIVPNSPSWFGGALNFYNSFHKPVYIIRRAGAPLFYVYELTQPFVWRCGRESKIIDPKTGEIIFSQF